MVLIHSGSFSKISEEKCQYALADIPLSALQPYLSENALFSQTFYDSFSTVTQLRLSFNISGFPLEPDPTRVYLFSKVFINDTFVSQAGLTRGWSVSESRPNPSRQQFSESFQIVKYQETDSVWGARGGADEGPNNSKHVDYVVVTESKVKAGQITYEVFFNRDA